MSEPIIPTNHNVDEARKAYFIQFREHVYSTESAPFNPSFIPPHAYWSSTEKAAFFKSLARHSRWRPDLITEDVGKGKTIADICSYIHLLEQATSRQSPDRDSFPIAHEVSEEWITLEEEFSGDLYGEEIKRRKRNRRAEMRKLRRTEDQSKQDDDSEGQDVVSGGISKRKYEVDLPEEGDSWTERFRQRKKEFTLSWEREDFLAVLEDKYLKTMDFMISTSESQTEQQEMVTEHSSEPEDVKHVKLTKNAQAGPSRFTTPDGDTESPPILLDKNQFFDDSPGAISVHLPGDLSPASRRRLRKRLWTRRKRALEKGQSIAEIPMDITKLKTGRKAKQEFKHQGTSETHVQPGSQPNKYILPPEDGPAPTTGSVSPAQDNSQGDFTDYPDSPSKRKPYGWSRLQALGIDGTTLRAEGLDIFHLENFLGIVRVYHDIYSPSTNPDESEKETPLTISYPFFQLLHRYLVHFLTRAIAYTITDKYVETRQMHRTRSIFQTGGADRIRAKNVHAALNLMRRDDTRKDVFKKLRAAIKDDGSAQSADEDVELDSVNSTSEDESEGNIEDDASPSSQPETPRAFTIALGDLVLPPFDDPHLASSLTWNPFLFSDVTGENNVLSTEDQATIDKELRADEKLERKDHKADILHEQDLWAGRGLEEASLDHDDTAATEAHQSAKKSENVRDGGKVVKRMTRKPGERVKSRMYIDSDDESL